MNTDFVNRIFLSLLLLITVSLAVYLLHRQSTRPHSLAVAIEEKEEPSRLRSSFSPRNRKDAVARTLYELRRLRDPKTGHIPEDMRSRELAFVQRLGAPETKSGKDNQVQSLTWTPRGPNNLGGRTRALAIDHDYNVTTNRRILAGGISGGMFLSEDGGGTWKLTTAYADFASVTSLVQDPFNSDVWYYGTGELLASAFAGGRLFGNSIPGQGIFKSFDGGNSWSQLPITTQGSTTSFDNPFDFVWNLAIHPQTGAIFAAVLGALLRSQDGGGSWVFLLSGIDANGFYSVFSDVAIAADGVVYATMSRNGTALSAPQFGVFQWRSHGRCPSNQLGLAG